MITLKFDADLIRAAMACQAKKDVRYYLQGILIAKNGDVVGTNGKVLFRGAHTFNDCDSLPHDIILSIDGTIPASAQSVTVELSSAGPCATGIARIDTNKCFSCYIIDGKYPQYQLVIVPRLPVTGTYSNVHVFDLEVLGRMGAVFGKNAHVALYCGYKSDALRIECLGKPDWVFIAMPFRADVPDTIMLFSAPLAEAA